MPPIIKKQIEKTRRTKSVSGYIKLVPLLFFLVFLILGWLISVATLKIFKPNYQGNSSCVPKASIALAGEGEGSCESCGSACGASCTADVAACGSSSSCGGVSCGGESCESCSSVSCGCWY